ncbi:hypothetical protein [Streptomyces sp. NPDC000877]|uniref:hypothetical protein n=1 Tax=unclassified Streptomyces TaxID=2593676 RepID=UPI00332EA66B
MIQRTTSATNSGGVDEGGDLGTQDLREPLGDWVPAPTGRRIPGALVAAALGCADAASTGWVACEGAVPLTVLLDRAMGALLTSRWDG